jgi:glycosyltransferase involved in cell wall biosynthesis
LKKLAIIITHPIQYYVPLFQLLAKSCNLKVFYTWGEKGNGEKFDPDFKQIISWDLPLLDGYEFDFLENKAKNPGSHHFKGIVNPKLIGKLKDFNPNAILVYGWAYQAHLQALRKFKGKIPIWFRGDSTILNQTVIIKSTLRRLFLKWVYQHIDKAFYVGSANKSYYLKFGLQENQLIFAPHAVDNNRFAEDRSFDALALRKKLVINKDEILILFAGKFELNKNPELLLKAFLQLQNKKAHLLFVGNGELENSLKSQISNLKSQKIHFMGFQNQTQMPVVYQACDLFCLPSQSETWGLAVNEAMAAGKAILVSNKVGCSIDLLINNENGYIFESNNLTDLKSKLSLMLTKENLIKMGKNSRKFIKKWSVEKQAEVIFKELNH